MRGEGCTIDRHATITTQSICCIGEWEVVGERGDRGEVRDERGEGRGVQLTAMLQPLHNH